MKEPSAPLRSHLNRNKFESARQFNCGEAPARTHLRYSLAQGGKDRGRQSSSRDIPIYALAQFPMTFTFILTHTNDSYTAGGGPRRDAAFNRLPLRAAIFFISARIRAYIKCRARLCQRRARGKNKLPLEPGGKSTDANFEFSPKCLHIKVCVCIDVNVDV